MDISKRISAKSCWLKATSGNDFVRLVISRSGTYCKRHPDGPIPVRVHVYLLEVCEELVSWPERDQRDRAWFELSDAATKVDEPELTGFAATGALSSVGFSCCRARQLHRAMPRRFVALEHALAMANKVHPFRRWRGSLD